MTIKKKNNCSIISNATPVILAGGESTRFGPTNKLLVKINDREIIDHVVGKVTESFERNPIIAIHRPEQRSSIENSLVDPNIVTFAMDDPDFAGPLGGIYGAIEHIGTDWAFVCGGDMPLLSREGIESIDQSIRGTSVDAVVPSPGVDMYEPLHAFYRCSAVLENRAMLSSDAGLRDLVSILSNVKLIRVDDCPEALERSLSNINTKSDLNEIDI